MAAKVNRLLAEMTPIGANETNSIKLMQTSDISKKQKHFNIELYSTTIVLVMHGFPKAPEYK